MTNGRIPTALVPVLEVALAAFWGGAAAIVGATVAPALFAVLPTRVLAGQVVGRVLPQLFVSGMLVALFILALELFVHRGAGSIRPSWGRALAASIAAIACGVAQFVVARRIERLRLEIGGAVDALAPSDPLRRSFGLLHAQSVALLGVAAVAMLVLLVLAARDASARHG